MKAFILLPCQLSFVIKGPFRGLGLVIILLSMLGFSSCKKDKCEQTVTYKKFVPVYMSLAELRSAVKSEPAQALKKPGKIYMKDNYIFVNEIDKGIHVIDNSTLLLRKTWRLSIFPATWI